MKYFLLLSLFLVICFAKEEMYYIQQNKKVLLTPIGQDSSEQHYQKYKKNDGSVVVVKDTFFVTFSDLTHMNEFLKTYKVSIEKKYDKNLYLVKSDQKNVLELVNRLSKEKYITSAIPNFYKKINIR